LLSHPHRRQRALHSLPPRRSADLETEKQPMPPTPQHFGDYQNEILAAGLRGELPALPVAFADLEARAAAALPPSLWSYVAGGARSEEHTSELQSRVDLVCRLLLEQ